MEISFTNDFIDTDIFELEYEEELREEKEIRDAVIRNGLVVYMYLDDVLIGESFGITPYEYTAILDEGQGFYTEEDAIADANMSDNESVYVWSTTILPLFRGMGYGKILRTEFSRYASKMGYAKLIGHATSYRMRNLIEDIGGIFHPKGIHEKWFDTERTAHFYTQFLTQTKEYNCGPFALAYLLETEGHTYSTEALEEQLGTTNEYGTNPTNIEKFLQVKKIAYRRAKELVPSSMIDITVDNDGHWITIVRKMDEMWQIYDPAIGLRLVSHKELLKDWHSPRYGIHKGFTLV